MTSPSVVGTPTHTAHASSTTHNAAIPAAPAGHLLLWFFEFSGVIATVTTPTGWSIAAPKVSVGSSLSAMIFKKISDGAEPATINAHTNTSVSADSIIYEIQDWDGDLANSVVAGTGASGTSGAPDPPSAAWAWGTDDALALAYDGTTTTAGTPTAPSGYSNVQIGTSGSLRQAIAQETLTAQASPEDPAAWAATITAWVAQTIVVRGIPTPPPPAGYVPMQRPWRRPIARRFR